MSHPLDVHAHWTRKYGINLDVDTSTDPEEVWANGGTYTFPSSAAACTLVSTSTDDDDGGTGAQTVRVYGLDADLMRQQEDVTMNGTSSVALANQYLRVHRMRVLTAGSGETNAGTISCVHGGATTLAAITTNPSVGTTMMAVYTIPHDYEKCYLTEFSAGLIDAANNAEAVVRLDIRPPSGAWVTLSVLGLRANGNSQDNDCWPGLGESLEPGTDIRVRVVEVNNDDTQVYAKFDVAQLDTEPGS